jgi:hypothetical protein
LIHSQVNSTKGTPSYFIFDYVLIDMVFRLAIFFTIRVFGPRIQRLFNRAVL